MRLWRLRNPKICHLQAGDPGKLVVWLEGLRARAPMVSVPVQVWRPKTQECRGQEKINVLAQQSGRERIQTSFTFLFYAGPTLGRAIHFTQSTSSNANLFWKHPHRQPKTTFNQMSGHPVIQSSWHIKLTLTNPNIYQAFIISQAHAKYFTDIISFLEIYMCENFLEEKTLMLGDF